MNQLFRPRRQPAATEWVPVSMRFERLTCLIIVLALFIVGLELANAKIKAEQGLTNETQVKILKYMPTIVAILVGFAWKSLASDFAMITPWAVMSAKWVRASESVLLNYIDHLDIVSIYQAMVHKHYGVLLVMSCGLISGMIVPLTNSLSFVHLEATKNITREIEITSKFVYSNNITIAPGWQTTALVSNQWWNTDYGPIGYSLWPYTTMYHTFQSFNTSGVEDSLLTAVADSFHAELECQAVQYSARYTPQNGNSSFTLLDDGSSGCALPISQQVIWPYNSSTVSAYPTRNEAEIDRFDIPPFLWLNFTACNAPEDFRLLATVMAPNIPSSLVSNGSANLWTSENIGVLSNGMICSPRYWSVPAEITVLGSTGQLIIDPKFHYDASMEIQGASLDLDIIYALLMDPTTKASRLIFEAAATNNWSDVDIPDSYDWAEYRTKQVMQKYNWIYLYQSAVHPQYGPVYQQPLSDGFFWYPLTMAGNSQTNLTFAWEMLNNATRFQQIVAQYYRFFMAGFVNQTARATESMPTEGRITYLGQRTLVRQWVLRALEASLAVLLTVTLLVGVYLRPRTLLSSSPESLAYIARILMNSPSANQYFGDTGELGEKDFEMRLKNMYCCLRRTVDEQAYIDISFEPTETPQPDEPPRKTEITSARVEKSNQTGTRNPTKSVIKRLSVDDKLVDNTHRYRPLGLRLPFRAAVLILLLLVVTVCAVLMWLSNHLGGFPAGPVEATAYTLIPSTILVLIGYCVQSIEQRTMILETYRQLRTNSPKSSKALFRRQVKESSQMLFRPTSWSSTLLPCLILLLDFPALKLLAGNLYQATYSMEEIPVAFPINVGPMADFIRFWDQIDPYYWTYTKGDDVFWDISPSTAEFNYQDIVGALNLPVITQNFDDLIEQDAWISGNSFEARIPGFLTNITCTPSQATDFNLFAVTCDPHQGYKVQFGCASEDCEIKFGRALKNITVSTVIGTNTPWGKYVFGEYPSLTDDSVAIIVADFSPLDATGLDLSRVTCFNGAELASQKPISPSSLGIHMPSLVAVNCTRHIQYVHVNVTFVPERNENYYDSKGYNIVNPIARSISVVSNSGQQFRWTPISYNSSTIEYLYRNATISTETTSYLQPEWGFVDHYQADHLNPRLRPYSFLALLCQIREMRGGSQFDLLDPGTLVTTSQELLHVWTKETLSQGFGDIQDRQLEADLPDLVYPLVDNQTFHGTFSIQKDVMKQNFGITVGFTCLIMLAVVCVSSLAWTIPRKTLLPKPPSSIAARMSLFAGSELVEKFRQNREVAVEKLTVSGKVTTILLDENVGLGWWSRTSAPEIHLDEKPRSRYGIDVGVIAPVCRYLTRTAKPSLRHGLNRRFYGVFEYVRSKLNTSNSLVRTVDSAEEITEAEVAKDTILETITSRSSLTSSDDEAQHKTTIEKGSAIEAIRSRPASLRDQVMQDVTPASALGQAQSSPSLRAPQFLYQATEPSDKSLLQQPSHGIDDNQQKLQ